MNWIPHSAPCGCGRRPPPPPKPPRPPREEPPRPPCDAPAPPPGPCGSYLMQRIIAWGRLHRRRECVSLCLESIADQAQAPLTVFEVSVSGPPVWEEIPACGGRCAALRVRIPLCVRLRDGVGCVFTSASLLTEEIPLRFDCSPAECWRGQPYAQAAVRLAGRPCPCGGCSCEVPLEVLAEGYILAPCTLGRPAPACPPPLPWYPQPIFDPYRSY